MAPIKGRSKHTLVQCYWADNDDNDECACANEDDGDCHGDTDEDADLYIIGAVCGSVGHKSDYFAVPPKVPINRRNCVSPISRHFSKVPINRRNCVSPISRHFSKVPINRRNCVPPISRHFSKVCINRRNYVSPISRHFSAEPSAAGARRGVRKCTCDKCTLPTIPLDTFQNCL